MFQEIELRFWEFFHVLGHVKLKIICYILFNPGSNYNQIEEYVKKSLMSDIKNRFSLEFQELVSANYIRELDDKYYLNTSTLICLFDLWEEKFIEFRKTVEKLLKTQTI